MDGAALALYVLSSVGLTLLLVWPAEGPGAWVRERLLRWVLPKGLRKALDCYICLGTWVALAAAPGWWLAGYHWSVIAWPVVPAAFWLVMPESRSGQ